MQYMIAELPLPGLTTCFHPVDAPMLVGPMLFQSTMTIKCEKLQG